MKRRLLALSVLFACNGGGDDPAPGTGGDDGAGADPYDVVIGPYDVDIRWTAYGIPHILAEDYGSMGYGFGYAFARDHACVLADQIVMVRSERSQYFGDGFIDEDFGWLAVGVRAEAEQGWFDLSEDMQRSLVGYAAGYNRLLEEGGADPRCNGEPWVRPIDHIDLLSYYLALGGVGSASPLIEAIGSGQPPASARRTSSQEQPPIPSVEIFEAVKAPELGSNGWAIGRDRSEGGGGLLLSNTHFPAEGERKWHEAHLTIPGTLDVYGASLMGVALINIGFNQDVAWTHTVSNAPRFTTALLELDPDDPTAYIFDGQTEQMTATDYTIEVLQDDGSVETVSRTLYSSRWGPVINAPILGWQENLAVAFTDANDFNLAMIETWFGMNHATSLDAFKTAQREIGGIPWVHTMATDTAGNAFYVDSSSVPNWTPEMEARYDTWLTEQPLAGLFADQGVIVVDGTDPGFEWAEEPGAWKPGLVPWDKMPKLDRTDFIFNANDNHWLSNTEALLEGYPALYGAEQTARTPRTRMNARYLSEVGEGTASGADGKFSLDEVEAAALGGRAILAEELKDEASTICEADSDVEIDGETIDLTAACAALAAWDGTASVDQPGAALWREILGSGVFTFDDLKDQGLLHSTGFDPADPVNTPTGLDPDGGIREAMGRAVLNLRAAGAEPGVVLGDIQFMRKDDADLPVPGGQDLEGVIAIATYSGGNATLLDVEPRAPVINGTTDLTEEGYQINYGNSFVMVVEMNESGPNGRAIMTYSQSDHPTSPHFDDQTALYGEARLRPIRFTEEDIAADTIEQLNLTLD
ncbi:MAG: penicillin acylase family protein [Myxococcota bacterium]